MMKYRQNDSTFIPREGSVSDPGISIENDPDPSKEKLILQIEEYNNKIKELEKQLKFKDTEIYSSNNLIVSLRKEINKLRGTQNPWISPHG